MITLSRRSLLALLAAHVPASAAPPDGLTVALIGDRTGSAQPGIYSRIFREVKLLHPDFAVTIGDAIEGLNDAQAPAQWAAMQQLWSTASFPIYHTPGNHDIWNASSEALFEQRTGQPPQFAWTAQNALFIILDNSRTEDLSPKQLQFLETTLRANAARSPKLVLFHRPFWIPFIGAGSGEFRLHQIAREHGVSHIFSGHGHQFVHLVKDGIHYTEIGSSGGSMDRGLRLGQSFRQGWFYHYLHLHIAKGQVAVTVRELPPPHGRGRSFRMEDWTTAGPKFEPEDPASMAGSSL